MNYSLKFNLIATCLLVATIAGAAKKGGDTRVYPLTSEPTVCGNHSPQPNMLGKNIREVATDAQIKFNISDGDLWKPDVCVFNKDFKAESMNFLRSGHTQFDISVPNGTYNILLMGASPNSGLYGEPRMMYIVLEDIEVNGEKEINVTSALADKIVEFKPALPSGAPAKLPLAYAVSEEDWDWDYTNANIDELMVFLSLMWNEGRTLPINFYSATLYDYDNTYTQEQYCSMRCNDFSEAFSFVGVMVMSHYDSGELDILTLKSKGVEEKVNTPDEYYVNIPWADFKSSPARNNFNRQGVEYASGFELWLNGIKGVGFNSLFEKKPSNIYLGTPVATMDQLASPIGTALTVVKQEQLAYLSSNATSKFGIAALPMIRTDQGWRYINNNHSTCGSNKFQIEEQTYLLTELPGHPVYSYGRDELNEPLGNSTPILSVGATTDKNNKVTITPEAYIGRYGETRNTDKNVCSTTVSLNGEVIYDSKTDSKNLSNWFKAWNKESHDPGVVELVFENNNIVVDEMPAYNITMVKYDERNADFTAPTMQMLIMKDNEGRITDRFGSKENGNIYFSAGDFTYIYGGVNNCYSCKKPTVMIEYAPNGSNEFAELGCTENGEYFMRPTFGHFYAASTSEIDRRSENGWYDLRFTLSDDAGNTQTQVISPAFHIEGTSGIKELESVGGEAGTNVELYDLQGRKTENNPMPGIYIRISGDKVQKIIIR